MLFMFFPLLYTGACKAAVGAAFGRYVTRAHSYYVVLHYHEIVHLGMWRYQRAVLHVVSHISIHVSKGFLALDLNATKERRLLGQLRISCEARMGRLRKIGLAGTIKDTSE